MRLAKENDRILSAPNINLPQFLTALNDHSPHVVLIGSWSEIIKPPTLLSLKDVPIINCHGSMLPKYRGACPCLAAIVNGDKQTGLTIHLIDEGIVPEGNTPPRFRPGDRFYSIECNSILKTA